MNSAAGWDPFSGNGCVCWALEVDATVFSKRDHGTRPLQGPTPSGALGGPSVPQFPPKAKSAAASAKYPASKKVVPCTYASAKTRPHQALPAICATLRPPSRVNLSLHPFSFASPPKAQHNLPPRPRLLRFSSRPVAQALPGRDRIILSAFFCGALALFKPDAPPIARNSLFLHAKLLRARTTETRRLCDPNRPFPRA